MTLITLHDLLLHELQDLQSAEQQLTDAIPKMAQAAHDSELKGAFEKHLEETKGHLRAVTAALEQMGGAKESTKCAAMAGIVKEGDDLIKTKGSPAVKDAALIGAAQRVEHYEIAAYSTARAYAELLGQRDVLQSIETILDQEHGASDKLTQLAQHINRDAGSAAPAGERATG